MEVIKMKLETMGRQIESTQTSIVRLAAQLESIFHFRNESARPIPNKQKRTNETTPGTTSPGRNFLTPGISHFSSPKFRLTDSKFSDRGESGSRKCHQTRSQINLQIS
jgi:hypothetical protein